MFTFNEIIEVILQIFKVIVELAYLNPGWAVIGCIIIMLIINFVFYLFNDFDNY